MKRKKGYYSISATSKMIGIHQQTIRMYEREGLITPERSRGNTRMFTEDDVKLLEQIIYYTSTLGVNLAGVEIILKMEQKINKLQTKINKMFDVSKSVLTSEKEILIQRAEETKNIVNELKKKTKKNR